MDHKVALQFLAWRLSLSPTVKMTRLGFWISEPFYSNGKNDLLPSIQIEEIMMDRIKLITDPGSRDKRSRH
jgi:hypothetical protein